MKFLKATIIRSSGTDTIIIETNIPSPVSNDEKLFLKFESPKSKSINYIKEHFNLEPILIDCPSNYTKRI